MSKNYRLRLTKGAWQTYTGSLSSVVFKDGVSVDLVPSALANQIAGIMPAVFVDEDGNETAAGRQNEIIAGATIRVPVAQPLKRQSDADRKREVNRERAKAEMDKVQIFTQDELSRIADKGGMKALREIADVWDVRDRSIPGLIKEILTAQSKFLEERNSGSTTTIETPEAAPEETTTEVGDDELAKRIAEAASRGVAEAINEEPGAGEEQEGSHEDAGEEQGGASNDAAEGEEAVGDVLKDAEGDDQNESAS